MPGSLKIMLWNSNGLQKHIKSLQLVLQQRNIDICLISETHFTRETYVNIKNYQIYHTIHPQNRARGGSAVVIKKSIKHYVHDRLQTDEFQATIITVETKTHSKLSFTAVYSPPRHSITTDQYKILINMHTNSFVMGGDYNCKHVQWGSRLTNAKGRALLKAINETGCNYISTSKPTYWPTDISKTPDLLDFFVTQKISKDNMIIEDGFDMCSDHSPIYLTILDKPIYKETPPYLFNALTDWDYFRCILRNTIDSNVLAQTTEELDDELLTFTTQIQQAAWRSTPHIEQNCYKGQYPINIRKIAKEKRKVRRKWQHSRYPLDKRQLNKLSKNLSKALTKFENGKLQNKLQNLTYDKSTNYSLWKCTSSFKPPTNHNPPLRKQNGSWAKSNEEKAKLFAEHLAEIFTPNPSAVALPLEYIEQEEQDIIPATTQEIEEQIKSLKPNKSPGFDLITVEVLKELPKAAIKKLTNIINMSLSMKYVPIYWKVAEVIMIHKPGKPLNETNSYRPISLLPLLSKLFEKILFARMKPVIDDNNLIPNHQFGFRAEHSTIEQIHRICDTIERSFENNEVCTTVFIDVSQAFDKVWHEGLLFKIKRYFPKQISDIIESYLSLRYYRVKYEDAYSDLKHIQAGVPQGSVLGPILYLIFTNDIPISDCCQIATFADDTAILSTGKTSIETTEKAQTAINQITSWTSKWRINLNNDKSVHIDFTYKDVPHPPLHMFGAQIPYANTAKYLGMNLDAKLKWKEHIKKKRAELEIRYRDLQWLIGYKSHLSLHNKLTIYRQILKPIWSYGIQLWGCAQKSNVDIIQRFQNKVLRKMVNAPWYVRNSDLHRDLGVHTVEDTIKKFANSHHRKLQHHINEEAARLVFEVAPERRLARRKPIDLLGEN